MLKDMKVFVLFLMFVVMLLSIQPVMAFGETIPAVSVSVETVAPVPQDVVLARVNGSAITQTQVERVIQIFIAQSRVSHDISDEARTQAEEAALEQLIATQLLYQAGLKWENEDIDKRITEKIDQEKAKFPTPAAYETVLKTNGFTEQDARQVVRNDLVVNDLVGREIVSKIVISEGESRTFYGQNQEKFTKPENTHISHILIGIGPQATNEEKRKAALKAESVRNRLLDGADFAAMARAESSCPSREEGGDLGRFDKGELIPEFEKGVSPLKSGEVSQVVETQDGYHVLKLVENNSARLVPFDDVKEKISSYLKQLKSQQAIREYVADLRKTAKIEMFVSVSPASSSRL